MGSVTRAVTRLAARHEQQQDAEQHAGNQPGNNHQAQTIDQEGPPVHPAGNKAEEQRTAYGQPVPGGEHRGEPLGHQYRRHQRHDHERRGQEVGILDRRPLRAVAGQHEAQQIAAIEQG